MSVSLITLFLAASSITLLEIKKYREVMLSSTITTLKMTVNNSIVALAFKDVDDVKNILGSLSADETILYSAVYTPDKSMFAEYKNKQYLQICKSGLSESFTKEELQSKDIVHKFSGSHLSLLSRIQDDAGLVGYLVICKGYQDFHKQIYENIFVLVIIVLLVSLICYFLAIVLQRFISMPISNLTNLVTTIHDKKGYYLRSNLQGFLEINKLSDGLNMMLNQIQTSQEELRVLASYDQLTTLPNRKSFLEKLNSCIKKSERTGEKFAVLYLDLDRFKNVNDTFGHSVGDKLLVEVAEKLKKTTRDSDALCRQGGDEFIVLMEDFHDPVQVSNFAERIIQKLGKPFTFEGHNLVITPSIGIVIYPDNGADAEALLKNSDTAMYRVKQNGKGSYCFYNDAMNEYAKNRLLLEAAIREAINQREFVLFYQPQIDLKTGQVCGFEALSRWRSQNGQIIMPSEYIPVAEETGLILDIGRQALEQAIIDLSNWQSGHGYYGKVAVNLSVSQFHQVGLYELVEDTLKMYNIHPKYLELEVTEDALMEYTDESIQIMKKFKKLGVSLAIDDFGTGYSSLSYLKKFPFDTLKIDRAFISEMMSSKTDREMVQTMINLAHVLGMKVVSEGVEEEYQRVGLRDMYCDVIQGYLISAPVEEKKIPGLFLSEKFESIM